MLLECELDQECQMFGNSSLSTDFDGTTVLCQVCGDKASGFHYGVHSCEGCKGFFRRSIQQKIQYKPCTKNQNCSILRINRNRCQYCRLKKCISVGMSRDAVRFGRVPKREKAKILAAMQSVNQKQQERAALVELEDERWLVARVVQAHMERCQFTWERVAPLLQAARLAPSYATGHTVGMACPLSPRVLSSDGELIDSQLFGPHIKSVVEFAKQLPSFMRLPEEDRVTLLKSSVFEVLLVWLACMFDNKSCTAACLNGQLVRRDTFASGSQPRFLLDSMFSFAEQLNALRLHEAEMALFCACVVLTTERPGLRCTALIGRVHGRMDAALRSLLVQNRSAPLGLALYDQLRRKVHDLKTLNALHSDMIRSLREPSSTSTSTTGTSSCCRQSAQLPPTHHQQLQQQQQLVSSAVAVLESAAITAASNSSSSITTTSSSSSSSSVCCPVTAAPVRSCSSTNSSSCWSPAAASLSSSSGYEGSEPVDPPGSPADSASHALPSSHAHMASAVLRAAAAAAVSVKCEAALCSPQSLDTSSSDEYMPLLKQALSKPTVSAPSVAGPLEDHNHHLHHHHHRPAGLDQAFVPHKKFRWMRFCQHNVVESVDGVGDEDDKAPPCQSPSPTPSSTLGGGGGGDSQTPTLSRILGAPPQRACSAEEARRREAVAHLLSLSAGGADVTVSPRHSPSSSPAPSLLTPGSPASPTTATAAAGAATVATSGGGDQQPLNLSIKIEPSAAASTTTTTTSASAAAAASQTTLVSVKASS